MRNYNSLIGRYPGADGMKTGFICASGFNLVASATRDGKRMIAVVLGASSSQARAMKAAQLLERGFNSGNNALNWLMPSLGTVESLQPVNADAAQSARGHVRQRTASGSATEDEDEALGVNRESRFALCRVPFEPAPEGQGCDAAAGDRHGRAGRGLYRSGTQARRSVAGHGRHEAEEGQATKSADEAEDAKTRQPSRAAKSNDAKPAAKPKRQGRHAEGGCAVRERAGGAAEAQEARAQDLRTRHVEEQSADHADAMTGAATRTSGPAEPIPLTVLTGFLGAGKTSLLNRLIGDPALAETAVIINEFGDVGLDHLLVREIQRRRRPAAERLPVLHAARRPGRRAGAAAARSRQRPRDVPPRDPGDDRARRSGAGAADRDGASLPGDALPARRRHHGGRRDQRRRQRSTRTWKPSSRSRLPTASC